MKKMKQKITAGLLMVMMLVVGVCSNVTTADAATLSAKQYLAKMEKAMSKVKSVEMSQSVSVAMKQSGQKVTVKAKGSGNFHFDSAKTKYVLKMTISSAGKKETVPLYMYTKKSGGKLSFYFSVDGKTYESQELGDIDDFTSAMGQVGTTNYSKAKIVKNEKIGKVNTVKISYQITGKDMQSAFNQSGMDQSKLDQMEMDFSKMKPIKVTYWIDKKTYRPVKCSMDMTGFMNDLLSSFLKAMEEADQSGASMGAMEIKCTSVKSTVTYKNFNKAKKITYPKGVK